jgi:outer membrane protein W
MIQPKNIAAAFALAGLVFAGSIASAEDFGRFYIEVGAARADSSDVDAEFTADNLNATWSLSDMYGGELQIGADLGHFRTDVKARVFAGEVDAITGVFNVGTGTDLLGQDRAPLDTIVGIATINAYWDIYDIKFGDSGAGITPFLGVGVGTAKGFMRACGNLNTEVAQTRCDHRNDSSRAFVGSVGALFSINEGVGLTIEYERIDTDIGGLDLNTASIGLRVSF